MTTSARSPLSTLVATPVAAVVRAATAPPLSSVAPPVGVSPPVGIAVAGVSPPPAPALG
ncbi:hypothetical protein QLQ85_17500 [Halomonas sp. M4R5S39]|uniref:hypothetical protein n=1 Tax=Halomonas kalidii TaxID=3043293 RepID=UPI0024A896C3|nr:hypothetical protein [Halomonas kalidii]MDI5986593.1 hypothetical protein [Halomonas kalidii]